MIFLNNLKNSFSFFIVTNFSGKGPESGRTIDQTETTIDQTETPPTTETINYLSPEQQKIKDKIDFLEKKYNTLISTGRITKAVADRLLAGLTSDPEIQNDPEAKDTIDMFNRYRDMFESATREGTEVQLQLAELRSLLFRASNALEYAAGVEYDSSTGEIKEMSLDKDKLKTITNKEFLALAKEERLQYITKDNIDSEYISNGSVSEIEFSFTFDGVFNRELYLDTTAGQVLPKEVGSITSGGVEYTRSGLKGEFFNGNNRLTIHEGTNLYISKIRTSEELNTISNLIEKSLESYEGELQIMIARGAISRGLKSDLVMKNFESILSKTPKEEYELKLEQLFTQVERIRGDYGLENNSDELKDAISDTDGDGLIDAYSRFNGKIDFRNMELREGEKGLLDMISIFESGGNYNSIYGNSNQSRINFTNMTIGQVQQYQRQYINSGQPSSAIGKYQFIQKTLKSAAEATGLGMNAKFSPENQDKMGLYLLKQRGLDSFMSGRMSIEEFQLNLSKEWAAIPKDMSGRSFYHGDGLNKAHLSSNQLRSYLTSMRETGINS